MQVNEVYWVRGSGEKESEGGRKSRKRGGRKKRTPATCNLIRPKRLVSCSKFFPLSPLLPFHSHSLFLFPLSLVYFILSLSFTDFFSRFCDSFLTDSPPPSFSNNRNQETSFFFQLLHLRTLSQRLLLRTFSQRLLLRTFSQLLLLRTFLHLLLRRTFFHLLHLRTNQRQFFFIHSFVFSSYLLCRRFFLKMKGKRRRERKGERKRDWKGKGESEKVVAWFSLQPA